MADLPVSPFVPHTLGEGGVSAGIEGYLHFAKAGRSLFGMAVEAGAHYHLGDA